MDARTFMDVHGRSWTLMDAHGRLRTLMDDHGRSRTLEDVREILSRDGHATVTLRSRDGHVHASKTKEIL
jgi:hypothetical protein